jgi:prenyltransferase beta subunit
MNSKSLLKGDPTDWLLEPENPSVRYFTLRDIFGHSEKDSEMEKAKEDIRTDSRVLRIFSKQKPEGYWEDAGQPYLPKYKGTYWQVMILSQLGLEKSDERVRKACEFIFQFQLDEGGFSSFGKPWARQKIREYEMSCLTGNVASSLIRLGYKSDERVMKALEWLVEVQNKDGGWLCPYWKAHIKDKHSCFMGTITPLDAFSEIPNERMPSETEDAIDKGVEFLLMHKLFKADHHQFKVINKNWLNLSFPCFSYDILRGLSVVTKLGYTKDERISDALEVLLQKQDSNGRWILERSPTPMHTTLEQKGRPSKWITLHALKVIKRVLAS